MAETAKIYIGKIEKKETQYGEIIKVGINEGDIQKLTDNLSERGWVNLVIKSKDGKSWMQVDDWKPRDKNE